MPELTSLREASGATQWQMIGPGSGIDIRHPRAVHLSRSLATASPIYHRLLSATLDMLVPSGTFVSFDLPRSSRLWPVLSWFLDDGPSALYPHLRTLLTSYFVDGELLLLPRVNDGDGRVTLTWVDPESVQDFTIGEGLAVVLSLTLSGFEQPLQVIRFDPASNTLRGDVFYFRIYPAGYSAGYRGFPLFAPMLDEIAALTELFYRRVNKLADLTPFYWDVLLRGASEQRIGEFLASPRSVPPGAGQINAHNEQVEWKLVAPDFEPINQELEFYLNAVAGAAGLSPEFMGHTPARDLSTEALFTSISHLEALRSAVVSPMLSALITFQLQQAAIRLRVDVPGFDINYPQLGTRSLQRAVQAFDRLVGALAKALEANIIRHEDAARVVELMLPAIVREEI